MSQRDFLQGFDAMAFGAFFDAGIADAATYTPPGGGAGVACQVLVDRGVRDFGTDEAPVSTFRVLVTFQLSQVSPKEEGAVEIGAETFTLVQRLREDESISQWGVQ